jgi:hypothetical protein
VQIIGAMKDTGSILTSVPPIILVSFENKDTGDASLPSRNIFADTIVDNDHRSIEVRAIEYIIIVLVV